MTLTLGLISSFSASTPIPKCRSTKRVWTDARRAAASERARKSKPWLHSSGPKTAAGKARSARNALKHGFYTITARAARARRRAIRAFEGHLKALLRLENYLVKYLNCPYNRAIKGLWEAPGQSKVHAPGPYHSPR